MAALRPGLPPGPWLVVGLARSGIAAAWTLHALGETVVGVDAGHPQVDLPPDVAVHTGADGLALVAHARAVVKSPGVPAQAPVIVAAHERGIPVIGELELAWRLLPNPFIGVTGTNGKTTTVELIGHIHREAGIPAVVAGNVGTALAGLVGEIPPDTVVIAECSSFQLEDTEHFAPEAAVLLNVTADHLDRHGTMEAYLGAKLRIFFSQGNDDIAVAPLDLEVEDIGGCAKRICFGAGLDADLSDRAGQLWWLDEPLLPVDELSLRGVHNRENAMAAAAVCLARGVDVDAVRRALRTFNGVPHRLEEVAETAGVLYVNDSKATNVASTLVALESFADRRVHLILGGQGKAQDFTALREPIAAGVAGVYLIGEDAPTIAAALDGVAPVRDVGTLEAAVGAARNVAVPGDVVLLSPACASFDQFPNFEARGDAFRALMGGSAY
jgi:UDP-N-acetylmuramoylalanine--D-glutamate ligase